MGTLVPAICILWVIMVMLNVLMDVLCYARGSGKTHSNMDCGYADIHNVFGSKVHVTHIICIRVHSVHGIYNNSGKIRNNFLYVMSIYIYHRYEEVNVYIL